MPNAWDIGSARILASLGFEALATTSGGHAATIARLTAYQEAGADVLFAPGVIRADDLRTVLEAITRPLNVLALGGAPPAPELAVLGVSRISVGSAFAFAALGTLVEAARELRE